MVKLNCNDGEDNDGNGMTDCGDQSVSKMNRPVLVVAGQELQCNTTADEDGDGLKTPMVMEWLTILCRPRLFSRTVCGGSGSGGELGTQCEDGLDNDGNGLIDCGESSCLSVIYCQNLHQKIVLIKLTTIEMVS